MQVNEHRYEQRDGLYTHVVYGFNNTHYDVLEDSKGRAEDAPQWLQNVVNLAKIANANLLKPPDVLVWFKASGNDLITFKFFNDQVRKE